ncbi:MAG TPA: TylF/MycF/NovP-related O-methyltransferase [Burkholderiales bacterium]|nr:TylF/MycF/NovP-related O-methyltransferase [Burkholderiales bacterium]
MRTELITEVAGQVRGVEKSYEPYHARRRLIYESLCQGVQYVINNGVEGDVAEFGTATGFSAYTIARAMAIYRQMYAGRIARFGTPPKTLHLFDSFQGLPQPQDAVDLGSPYVQAGVWREGAYKVLTEEELVALCTSVYDADKVLTYGGWFADTLQKIRRNTKFAMLHMDCDLYSSSLEVLDHISSQDQIADGCVVFFDDWNTNRSSPLMGQRRAWRETVDKHGIKFSDCGDYAILGHKFIVHAS